jgi:hypothetical protein
MIGQKRTPLIRPSDLFAQKYDRHRLHLSGLTHDSAVLTPALPFCNRSELTMADDKKKVGQPDRNLISFKEKYEFDYAVKQLQKQVPDTTKQEARNALTKAARQVSPSEGREKAMRAARKILKNER